MQCNATVTLPPPLTPILLQSLPQHQNQRQRQCQRSTPNSVENQASVISRCGTTQDDVGDDEVWTRVEWYVAVCSRVGCMVTVTVTVALQCAVLMHICNCDYVGQVRGSGVVGAMRCDICHVDVMFLR